MIGADNVVRVNVDGICKFRVRMEPGCRIDFNDQRLPTALKGYAILTPGTPQAVFLEPEPHTARVESSPWRARE